MFVHGVIRVIQELSSINLKVPEYVVSVLNEIEVYIFVSVQER